MRSHRPTGARRKARRTPPASPGTRHPCHPSQGTLPHRSEHGQISSSMGGRACRASRRVAA
eukprot:4253460-Prymnesium_polylepis.1